MPDFLTTADFPATPQSSKFRTQLLDAATRHGYATGHAVALVNWCRRFILFHGVRHPQEMARAETALFLDHVAETEKDALRAIAELR